MGAFTNIEKIHTQTARPATTTWPYKYFFRAGIDPATRSTAVGRSKTAPTVPSVFEKQTKIFPIQIKSTFPPYPEKTVAIFSNKT